MTTERPGPTQSVPTLTEVVAWPDASETAQEPGTEPIQEPVLPVAPVREPPHEPGPAPEREPPNEAHPPPPGKAAPAPEPMQVFAIEGDRSLIPGSDPGAEERLIQRILQDLQQQIDLVLEYRVREVLTPILTRTTDALMRDARAELSRALRELVVRSVAQELRRQRSG